VRTSARAVVVGGGVGGASILYWLARLGWSDIVLCERAELTSGSTFHSAGLVGQLRGSLSLTCMMMSSVDLYRALDEETGLETGWREVGSLRLASSRERMEELARQAGWAKTFGLPLELVSAEEAQRLFRPMSLDGVLGAAFLPTDGYVDPSQLTFALAEGASLHGAEILTNTRVEEISVDRGRVTGVVTDRGAIETEVVVNAGGIYAREIAALAGVDVPVIPLAHEYLITRPSGLPLDLLTMRDPSLLDYFRGESGGLVMGGYERSPAPWALDGVPRDFNASLWRDGESVRRRDGRLSAVPGGADRMCARARDLLRAGEQLVQALRRRQLAADDPRAGHDNRTCGFRVVGHGAGLRVETRIPGADVNPYLAFAALVAAGLYGIEHELELEPPFEGNAYESGAPRFPSTLREAIAALEQGEMARAALGDQVIHHYLNYARTEQRLFDEVVTCYERERMFERG
jgi:glycine/D-amino acid oxidase-like deaminating enzyme